MLLQPLVDVPVPAVLVSQLFSSPQFVECWDCRWHFITQTASSDPYVGDRFRFLSTSRRTRHITVIQQILRAALFIYA